MGVGVRWEWEWGGSGGGVDDRGWSWMEYKIFAQVLQNLWLQLFFKAFFKYII